MGWEAATLRGRAARAVDDDSNEGSGGDDGGEWPAYLTDKLYSKEAWEQGGEAEVQIRNALMTGMKEGRNPSEGAAKGKERAVEKMEFAKERRGRETEKEQRGAERAGTKIKKEEEFAKLDWGDAPEGSTRGRSEGIEGTYKPRYGGVGMARQNEGRNL